MDWSETESNTDVTEKPSSESDIENVENNLSELELDRIECSESRDHQNNLKGRNHLVENEEICSTVSSITEDDEIDNVQKSDA